MLAYILAIAIGSSSLVLFLTAFVQPEIHRKDDFFWSGIGLFYALVLWFCANRLTGGVLLGQAAAVALILSYNWQNLKLRKAIAHPEKEITLESFSVTQTIQNFLGRLFSRAGKPKAKAEVKTATTTPPATVLETVEPSLEEETRAAESFRSLTNERDSEEIIDAQIESSTQETSESSSPAFLETEVPDASTVKREEVALSQQPESQKRSFSLKNLFGFSKKKSSPATTGKSQLSNLDAILDEEIKTPIAKTEQTENLDVTGESKVENAEFEKIEKETTSAPESDLKAARASRAAEIIDSQNQLETETAELVETIEEQTQSETETANSDFPDRDKDTSSFSAEVESEATPPEPPTPENLARQEIETKEEKEAINVEEIAPEVELAPPAEPLGEGDPHMRTNLEESSGESQQEKQKE